jgi:hypothetical protein
MSKTKHVQARMSQRGIRQDVLELAYQFGEKQGDKSLLGRKALTALLEELRQLERTALKALDKGGLVLVEANGRWITTYNLEN